MEADERTRTAIARLTANEKECLRRRLLPQTAKEMAIDLGVSPHAVEKRLKMARTKLDTSSSLAAARMLAAVERYQPLVPQASDLPDEADPDEEERVAAPTNGGPAQRHFSKGLMMITAICLIALVAQDIPSPTSSAASPGTVNLKDIATRKVGMDEAAAFERMGFRQKDTDGSGYLDPGEASTLESRDGNRDPKLAAAPPAGAPDPAAERKWMAKLDTDRDGRVSEDEYVGYMLPWTLWQGVPADWQPGR